MSDQTPEEDAINSDNLKDNHGEECASNENHVPARVKGTRCFSPPFPRVMYERFLNALKKGVIAYPSSKELRRLGFAKAPAISPRQKFKLVLTRLDLETVDGALVFGANPKQDVLVSKRSRKIILPVEDAEMAIKRAHSTGSNRASEEPSGAAKRKHLSVAKTISVLAKDFAVNRREFGIDIQLIKKVVHHCHTCVLAEISSDNTTKEQENPSNSKSSEESRVVSKTPPVMCEPRFTSMVAHIPDKQCIWYDRQSIAQSTNRFRKLLLVIKEIKGELALVFRGNADAKERIQTKLYCGQLLIKDYMKSLQQSLYVYEDPLITAPQFASLQQEYEEAGQAVIFKSDLWNVLTSFRNNKMILSPMLAKQIEEFLIAKQ